MADCIQASNSSDLRLYLYDIPSVVSVDIAQSVINELIAEFGEVIAGIKDSVADWGHVEASLKGFPGREIFVGNEIFLPQALALGGAGAISGLGNIAPAQMAALATATGETNSEMFGKMTHLYNLIAKYPVIPAVKALTAYRRNIPGMATPRPPLAQVDLQPGHELVQAAEALWSASV